MGLFSIVGITIACLGLIGLITYTVERRKKEIGIRKVYGASIISIVRLLTKEFLLLIVVSNIMAWPISWYAMNLWLENFAYRTDIGIFVFIGAGFSALIIALTVISVQSYRAAAVNPIDSIQYE